MDAGYDHFMFSRLWSFFQTGNAKLKKKTHKKEKMVKKIRNEIISLLCLRVFALQILEGEINAFGVRNS
jgi:hypothetical protein